MNAHLCSWRGPKKMLFPVLANSIWTFKSLCWNHLQFHQSVPMYLLPELPFSSRPWAWWSCFADKALAPFEPCTSECFSHAKWRTVVLYGQRNIVLGCLCCTWWYGANRGICQMQSGVMEGRDTARGIENKGKKRGRNSLSRAWISTEHQLRGDKDQTRHTPPHTHTYNKLKSQMRSFLSNTIASGL